MMDTSGKVNDMIASGRLTKGGLQKLDARLEKINKRAVKMGKAPFKREIVDTHKVVERDDFGVKREYTVFEVVVHGEMPRFDGWQVVARIETGKDGCLVHTAPGIEKVDDKYRSHDGFCDHCKVSRFRTDVFVLKHNDGREITVGRNCMADFIREGDASYIIWLASLSCSSVMLDDDELSGFYYKETPMSVSAVLEAASICIRKLGWVSSSKARDFGIMPTVEDVRFLLCGGKGDLKGWKEWIESNSLCCTDFDQDQAMRAMEWIQGVDTNKSDYLYNLQLMVKRGEVLYKDWGYVVSLIPTYQRAMEKAVTVKRENATKVFLSGEGRVKDIGVKCTGLRSFEGYYGVTTLVKFDCHQSDGVAPLVWFASGDKTEYFEVGGTYTLTGTIKEKKDDAQYGKQTVLTRVKC